MSKQLDTVTYNVKAPDGSMMQIPIDANLPPDKLGAVIEASVRAKMRINNNPIVQRQAKYDGMQPAAPLTGSGTTVGSSVLDFLKGAAKPFTDAGEVIGSGVKQFNHDPLGVLGAAGNELADRVNSANRPENPAPVQSRAAEFADTGTKQGLPAAFGQATSNAFLDFLAAKSGGSAASRARIGTAARSSAIPVTVIEDSQQPASSIQAPFTPTRLNPGDTSIPMGKAMHNLNANLAAVRGQPAQPNTINFGGVNTAQAADALRDALANGKAGPAGSAATPLPNPAVGTPAADPSGLGAHIRIPVSIIGHDAPVYMKIPGIGRAMDMVKRATTAGKNTAAEAMWVQRLLQTYGQVDNPMNTDGGQPSPQQ